MHFYLPIYGIESFLRHKVLLPYEYTFPHTQHFAPT
ncbi:hypothetical protein EVA_13873 [gut metagenome]|uniref:Uncharacterized protein n=1 Tax=gut metagenome TaxID=749906 RepID=J9FST3_9ZZZZ